jgi:hypothetical protein
LPANINDAIQIINSIVYDAKKNNKEKCKNFSEALSSIVNEYGKDLLIDRDRLLTTLYDCFPTGKIEKKTIITAFSLDIPAKFASVANKTKTEQITEITRCVKMLIDYSDIAQNTVKEHLWALAEAMGMDVKPLLELDKISDNMSPSEDDIKQKRISKTNIENNFKFYICNRTGSLYMIEPNGKKGKV